MSLAFAVDTVNVDHPAGHCASKVPRGHQQVWRPLGAAIRDCHGQRFPTTRDRAEIRHCSADTLDSRDEFRVRCVQQSLIASSRPEPCSRRPALPFVPSGVTSARDKGQPSWPWADRFDVVLRHRARFGRHSAPTLCCRGDIGADAASGAPSRQPQHDLPPRNARRRRQTGAGLTGSGRRSGRPAADRLRLKSPQQDTRPGLAGCVRAAIPDARGRPVPLRLRRSLRRTGRRILAPGRRRQPRNRSVLWNETQDF
jgi:hypothetical protein